MDQRSSPFIHFGREVCNHLQAAEQREWWIANGLGGYAAGTVAGTLTRRYHGLLVAPLKPPLGRTLVFAKADASLILGEACQPLHSNRWVGGAVEPRGYLHLESFHLEGNLPVWRYALGDVRIEARIWMESGANTTYMAWRLLSAPPDAPAPRLTVRLLVNTRDHHGQTSPGAFDAAIYPTGNRLQVAFSGYPNLNFQSCCGHFTADKTWVENFDLPLERARGLPDRDNHLCVGDVDLPLHAGEWTGFVASLDENASPYLGEALSRRMSRDNALLLQAKAQDSVFADAPPWLEHLVTAADSFLIRRPITSGEGISVVAGYPWFGDWGRDTFIALPGLTLSTHRPEVARHILESWATQINGGLLPNHFPEDGAPPEYNTADAALWYVEAWRAYVEASHDLPTLRRHYDLLADIIDHHVRGTHHGIAMDASDGLLRAGVGDTQLTWMDARVEGRPVTSRAGKPVEINALWYNALASMADFAHRLGKAPHLLSRLTERTRSGFMRFVRADGLGLVDVLDGPDGNDSRLRPNQIFAVSLTHSPLDAETQERVVARVGQHLLTSYGLRTLAPFEPGYRPHYGGGVNERDGSYHQGSAWAWLLGHYALAVYRVTGDADQALSYLDPLRDHLMDAGLGSISELFDGDVPHSPGGTPSQAWSVACTLQAWKRLTCARRKQGHDASSQITTTETLR